jgi:ATP-binding cassette, subfamily B, bacterial MsbA
MRVARPPDPFQESDGPPVSFAPDPTPDAPGYRSSRLFGRLWRGYLRPHRFTMLAAFVVMVIEGSTLGLLSWMLRPLFDRVFTAGGETALIWVGLAILGLFVLRAASSVLSKGLIASVSQRSANAMQSDLLAHILTLDTRFFQEQAPGVLIERVQGDAFNVQGVWVTVVTGVGRDFISLAGLFIVALSIDPVWTLSALVGAPLLLVPAVTLQRYLRAKSAQLRDQAGLKSTRLDEVFHGIQAIKLNQMETYQLDRFARVLRAIRQAEVRSSIARSLMPAMVDVVTGIGFFAVLMLGGREVAAGNRTVGEFMAFFTAMALTFQPLRRLGDLAGSWQVAAASLERMFRLLDLSPQLDRPTISRALPPPGPPAITMTDVRFAYPGVPVLNGLTFSAAAGQTTAIVGPSGSGKTTIFHLLTALMTPDAGQITIGGVDVRDMSLSDQRALFATVSQEAALFDETLRENILMGRSGITDAQLHDVIETANLTEFLASLPEGLDTPVGPRGSALSGGQRQRVAIARALILDAPILLLDEATSALDARSETLVAEALTRLARGRTTLVIAHRLATVREADQILVLEQGHLVEQGRHDALLQADGLYAGLYRLQFKG